MHHHERLVRTQIEDFQKGDIEGWLSCVADDLVVHVAPGHRLLGDYHGSQQFIEQFMGPVMELTGGVEAEPHDVLASDEHAVSLFTIRAQRNGIDYEWRLVDVYHIKDGKIAEMWWNPFDKDTVDRCSPNRDVSPGRPRRLRPASSSSRPRAPGCDDYRTGGIRVRRPISRWRV